MKHLILILLLLTSCKTRKQPKYSYMGLDTTHDAWHGPYSSFNRFRHKLADQIGIRLDDYKGYSDAGTKDLDSIPHPIMPLLNHSDCDGELTPEQCKSIADGLDLILKSLPIPANGVSEGSSFIEDVIQFRDGCLLAYSKKENIEFH
jgi:hypothetical protein